MINITLPDGAVRQYEAGVTAMDIAKSISEGLARKVLAAKVNGQVVDSSRPITTDSTLQLLTWSDAEGKSTMWHSSAHLMAEALESIYPGVKFGYGPALEGGFYYDIDLGGRTISDEDLRKVETKMAELAKANNPYERREVSKAEALDYFTQKGDEYKIETIGELQDGKITFYTQGNFTDLCRGPHIPSTGFIKAIKLTNIAGAYWRGNEKNKMLTRIYGVTFPNQKELDEHLFLLEEAKKRDHRKLGKELELFTFSEKVGLGLPLWLPKGAMLRERLQAFLQKAQLDLGYLPVVTPHIGNVNLYKTSGHYEKYGKDSFQTIHTPEEGEEFMLKPMNCPHHCEIYKASPKSYKDLPVRFAEFGTVYRYEQHGELHGLTRVRGFTQDDAHLFCRPDQVKEEFMKVIDLVLYVFNSLSFTEYTAQISLRHQTDRDKYIGTDENWNLAEQAIIEAATEKGLNTVTEYDEAAFYGPKLDFMVKDALGRKWQLGTIQVDYNLPERFDLEYIGADNQRHRPVMIHRAPFGSLERFIAVLIEHCGGKFPLWLTPTQVKILPISDKSQAYAEKVAELLKKADIRAEIDDRGEKIGKKIRETEIAKVPYMLVLGEKEAADNKVAVRRQAKGDLGAMEIEQFITLVQEEVINRKSFE
ncbi:threonine--tRNA ligase [Chitinophaga sancti]|uniref:Threonine--tRNA ligase n=1 Tax=Chitinophaga sancti TaxID=1004 RepID=A0A1K1N8X0_9BACT|nr:threonine--tRNA ligase [Chitinophaga sancti]WQD63453.1 threonine--tRNA ligase [Chitinophaga sancti]WQG90921.1 threonine--tRNA ligase [Chitinophaga sancti]SFW31761.1 threonyl-tRNA synthetase [Chitinophaga sancti]